MFGSTQMFGGYGTQAAADAPMESSQSPTKNQQGQQEAQTVIPVTIRMLEKAVASQVPGGDLRVDGRVANTVVVVAAIEDLERKAASMEFALNDATGRMKARFFYPSADLKLDFVANNKYVSAVGVVKTQPFVHVSILGLHELTSPDQISYHTIEVAHASLRSKAKPASPSGFPATKAMDSSPARVEAPMAAVARPLISSSPQPTAVPQATPAAAESGPLKDRISAFLSGQENPEGVALTKLCTEFGSAAPEAVKAAVRELLDDGSAYTTIDDEHFAAV